MAYSPFLNPQRGGFNIQGAPPPGAPLPQPIAMAPSSVIGPRPTPALPDISSGTGIRDPRLSRSKEEEDFYGSSGGLGGAEGAGAPGPGGPGAVSVGDLGLGPVGTPGNIGAISDAISANQADISAVNAMGGLLGLTTPGIPGLPGTNPFSIAKTIHGLIVGPLQKGLKGALKAETQVPQLQLPVFQAITGAPPGLSAAPNVADAAISEGLGLTSDPSIGLSGEPDTGIDASGLGLGPEGAPADVGLDASGGVSSGGDGDGDGDGDSGDGGASAGVGAGPGADGYRRGGRIPNRGTRKSAPVPITAHEGEYVVREPAARKNMPLLNKINREGGFKKLMPRTAR